MATLEQVKIEILSRLASLGRPLFDPLNEPEAYVAYEAEYLEALKGFEPASLSEGMALVRNDWSGLTWPPPGFIHKRCIQIERDNRPLAKPLALPAPPPVADTTPEEREVMRERMGRLLKMLKRNEMPRLSDDEAWRHCQTGEYPEGYHDRPVPPPVMVAKPQPPKPPPTARQNERAARLQRRANAARAELMEG